MVKIHFWQDKDNHIACMKVTGHARTAPNGADLVCASASMLVYTVAQAMVFMYQHGCLEEKPKLKIREGKASISVVFKEEYYAEVLHSFWVAQSGAYVLAKNYPGAVSLNHLTV